MHELPVVLDIIKVMEKETEERGISQITRINLVIGELSSVIDDSVQMYFELIAEKTRCEGAKLTFEHIPAILKCNSCGHEFPHQRGFDCPVCGKDAVLVKGTGREFYIKSYEYD